MGFHDGTPLSRYVPASGLPLANDSNLGALRTHPRFVQLVASMNGPAVR